MQIKKFTVAILLFSILSSLHLKMLNTLLFPTFVLHKYFLV